MIAPLLCVTVRFLQPLCHGRNEEGLPEWPPSPMRLFQSLAAAAAGRWNERQSIRAARPMLDWLAMLPPPTVRSAAAVPAKTAYRSYVPDNVADKVASSWLHGSQDSIADYRVEKDIRPNWLCGGDAVHYLYDLPAEGCPYLDVLAAAARSITHLGWGIDMAYGDARLISPAEADALPGEVWRPATSGGVPLRIPVPGSLDDLSRRHHAFLHRLEGELFRPVPPLSAYRVVRYRRADEPSRPAWAAFRLASVEPGGRNPAFAAAKMARVVAAWTRHAAGRVCPGDRMAAFLHGHRPGGEPLKGPDADRRVMFLPLPTWTDTEDFRRLGPVRRVLLAAPEEAADDFHDLRRRLAMALLFDEESRAPVAMLEPLAADDGVCRHYVAESAAWSSVTPVLLPGYDDPAHLRRRLKAIANPTSGPEPSAVGGRPPEFASVAAEQRHLLDRLDRRVEDLLRKALGHAGLPQDNVQIEWRSVGFLPGADPAKAYRPPENLAKFPAYHVRLRFPRKIAGPIAIGAGRYRGLGVFLAAGE